MGVKLFILLALASIAEGSHVPTLTVTNYGLSDEQVAVLNEIIGNQEAAASAYSQGIKTVFEILCDLEAEADEDRSQVFEALAGVKNAIEISFDSLEIALEESCPAVELFRNAAYGSVNDAAVHVAAAIKLSQSGDYYEILDAIEVNRIKVEKDFTNMVEGFYDSISTCLNTTDTEALAVIKDAHDGSFYGVVDMTNAIFNAIRIRAAAFTSGYEKRAFISNMQDFENKALVGVTDDIEHIFSLLKTRFIYSHLNQGGILSKLFSNQYALTASYRGYRQGNTVVFDRIIEYLKRIYFELSDDGNLDFSQDDLAPRTAVAFFNSGDGANYASIFALHPDATFAIAIAQENTFNTNAEAVMGYFDAIDVAAAEGADYSDVTDYIEAFRDAAASLAPVYVQESIGMIRNNQTFSAEIEAEFATLVEKMIDGSVHCTNSVLDAVGILAEATHTSEVRTGDFYAVRGLLDASNSGCGQFTEGVSAASFLVLVANNAS